MAQGVRIIDTGVANNASLLAAFERLGRPARLTNEESQIREAGHVVLPGVGAVKGIQFQGLTDAGAPDALAERFGSQCTVIAVDARARGDGWEVVVRSGKEDTGLDALDWMREVVQRGAGEILLTSWDRDGTKAGYNLPLLRVASEAVPIIASGGVSSSETATQTAATGQTRPARVASVPTGSCNRS